MDPTGTGLVIFYNQWRDVKVSEVHDCFKELPEDAFAEVKAGDVLWRRSEPYAYSAGKVYGYERIEVTGVRRTDHGVNVDYTGSVTRGTFTLQPGEFEECYQLVDADGLAALVKKHEHKITHVHEPSHDAELARARGTFEATWNSRRLPQ